MTDKLNIQISATDNASKVFSTVGKSATTMGDAIENAGKDGAKGFKEVGTAAEQNTGKFSKLKAEATLLGGAIGTVGGAMALLGKSAREQERLTDGITRAYGDAADEMLDFSDHIQDTTRFSNDAAQASLLLANSLVQNYGLSADSIQELLARSADLAQMYGLTLPDAMQRTAAALRGEGESAEALGLNMSDATMAAKALSEGIEGWSVPGALTEAEKAAFRFKVFMEQSEFATGTAGDAADTAGGKFRQLANEMQDVGQDVGAFLGPVGSVAAELAPLAIALPVVGAGLGKLGTAAKGSSLAMGALGLATNPVVLGIVGLTAAIGAGYLIYQRATEGQRDLAESFDSTRDAIDKLKTDGFTGLATELENLARQFPNLADSGNMAADALAESFGGIWEPGSEWNQELGIFVTEADAAMVAIVQGMNSTAEDVTAANNKMTEAMTSSTVDIAAFTAEVQRLMAEMMEDPGDAKGEGWFLDQIAAIDLSNYQKQADTVISANGEMLASIDDINSAFADIDDLVRNLRFEGMDEAAADIEQVSNALLTLNGPISGAVMAYGDLSQAGTLTAESLKDAELATKAINEALASGNYDNAAIVAEYFRILNDPSLDPNEKAAAIFALGQEVNNTNTYMLETGGAAGLAAGAITAMGGAFDAATASIELLNEQQQHFIDSQIAWLANGDNILDFLDEFLDSTGALGEQMTTLSGKSITMMNDFGQAFMIADNLDDAAKALDRVLGYFDMIDSLGDRSSSAGAIADYLFGEGGDPSDGLGPLAELMDANRISVEQFNQAIADGVAIQESNLAVQEDLNKIRADQLPLLKENQLAYEAQIDALSQLNPEEQRHALLLQDSAFQSKLAQQYSTAYAASLGEIPEHVASQMILEAAEADKDLKDMLLTMGLLEEKDGVISVSFPDGPTVQDTIIGLTESLDALIVLMGGDPVLHLGVQDDVTPIIDKYNRIIIPDLVVPIEPEDNVGETLSFYSNHPEIVIPVIIGRPGHDNSAPSLDVDSQTVTITTELDDQASEGLASIQSLAESLDGLTSVFIAELDDDATRPIEDVSRLHESQDGNLSVLIIDLRDDATRDIDAVARRHGNVDGDVSTLRINANTTDAESGVQWARNLNGDVLATSYINVVTQYSNSYSSGYGPNQLGGIVGLATGGLVPVELAEAGPEMLHFANGGVMPIFERGNYLAPAGTYVSPAPAAASSMGGFGGITLTIPIYGNVYGLDDLEDKVGDAVLGALQDVLRDHRISSGVF